MGFCGTLGMPGMSLVIACSIPSMAIAGQSEQNASNVNGSNKIHQVNHSIANNASYTADSNSGYKWGKERTRRQTTQEWSDAPKYGTGYKWNSGPNPSLSNGEFAGATGYKWGIMSFPIQSGYKWGVRSFSDQAGYKWGVRSF